MLFYNLNSILFFILMVHNIAEIYSIEKICGEYVSEKLKTSKGYFKIDSFLTSENEISKLNDSLLCIYKFVGNKDEKVMINFENFDIKAIAPDCINEYIDIYIEVTNETLNNYVETNFLSRWCGWKKPSTLISYNNIIVFAYHTDGTNRGSTFSGSFEFIDAEIYNNGKKPNSCEYEFNSEVAEQGIFLSPTYPGTYPNILNCTYKFIGRPDERVMIYFEEILIHYGADHCPYDVLKLYDYQKIKEDDTNPIKKLVKLSKKYQQLEKPKYERIHFESYCGRKLNFTVYSSNNLFEVEFEMFDSLGNEEYSEDENKILLRKGFKAFYKFSKEFADLSFITGTHLTGTNCDQKITSFKPNGIIYSPNYFRTNSINASCKYIFEGLDDNYNLESIKLNFQMIDVKQSSSKNNCNENSVSHFVVYGSDKSKNMYCFNRLTKEPKELRSQGSQMVLIFNSIITDQYTPSNFQASYSFYTEFGIEGTRVYQNRTCLFTYSSENIIHGTINSPRYPQNYPLNIKCLYIFDISSKYERVLFTFKDFKLSALPGSNCSKSIDHLSIYQLSSDEENNYQSHEIKQDRPNWILLNRYCDSAIPTPLITDQNSKKVLLSFYSDNIDLAQGFILSYNYVRLPECKYTYHANDNISSGQITITSDLEATYYCDWYIKAEDGKSILLSFKNQYLEDPKLNQFVIKVYDMNENLFNHDFNENNNNDYSFDLKISSQEQQKNENSDKNSNLPKYEYTLDKSIKYFQIDSSFIRLQLVIGKTMIMSDGRLIINWITASRDKICKQDEFMCNQTRYCIKSLYYCDGIDHCPFDYSDEPDKCFIQNAKQTNLLPPFIQITSFVSSIVVLVIFLSICIFCRLKSLKKSQVKGNSPLNNRNLHPPLYYKYSPANSVDYLEAAITSV